MGTTWKMQRRATCSFIWRQRWTSEARILFRGQSRLPLKRDCIAQKHGSCNHDRVARIRLLASLEFARVEPWFPPAQLLRKRGVRVPEQRVAASERGWRFAPSAAECA